MHTTIYTTVQCCYADVLICRITGPVRPSVRLSRTASKLENNKKMTRRWELLLACGWGWTFASHATATVAPQLTPVVFTGDWTQARLITVSGSARTVPMSHRDKLWICCGLAVRLAVCSTTCCELLLWTCSWLSICCGFVVQLVVQQIHNKSKLVESDTNAAGLFSYRDKTHRHPGQSSYTPCLKKHCASVIFWITQWNNGRF